MVRGAHAPHARPAAPRSRDHARQRALATRARARSGTVDEDVSRRTQGRVRSPGKILRCARVATEFGKALDTPPHCMVNPMGVGRSHVPNLSTLQHPVVR